MSLFGVQHPSPIYLSALGSQRAFHPEGELATARVCSACQADNEHDPVKKAPMYAGLDVSRVNELSPSNITWDFLKRLRELVTVKLLVKGIVTGEDAVLCVSHGVDGVIISNHGGRDEETLRSTIECLPEVSAAVAGRRYREAAGLGPRRRGPARRRNDTRHLQPRAEPDHAAGGNAKP